MPPVARRRAEALGEPGRAWIASLPDLVADLSRAWNLTPQAVLSGGTEALIVACDAGEGGERVLKLILPGQDPEGLEARVLGLANGEGYARLYRSDLARGALLMERLGPSLASLGWPAQDILRALCDTLRTAWRPIAGAEGFPDGAEKAERLAGFIRDLWNDLGSPVSPRVLDRALAFAEDRRRAFDPDRAVLAHGDAHPGNTLLVPGSGPPAFRFIDPDGLFIEPALDLGVVMREGGMELLQGDAGRIGLERCAALSAWTGVPQGPIWQWGFVERVSTGLLATQLKMEIGPPMLAVAEAWAGIDPPE